MKKQREKQPFYETVVFNDVAYARDEKEKLEEKIKKAKIGLAVSIVVSICSLIALKGAAALIIVSIAGSIASYILCGGFSYGLKFAKKVAFLGWVIAPFPYDLATGGLTFFFAVVGFFMFPIVFTLLSYNQLSKDYKEAEKYLSYYQPVDNHRVEAPVKEKSAEEEEH